MSCMQFFCDYRVGVLAGVLCLRCCCLSVPNKATCFSVGIGQNPLDLTQTDSSRYRAILHKQVAYSMIYIALPHMTRILLTGLIQPPPPLHCRFKRSPLNLRTYG